MDDIRRDLEAKCRKFFEDFANSQGLIFEESYDPFYELGWVIRFSNKSTGKHWEHVILEHGLHHWPEKELLSGLCWPMIQEATKYLY